MAEKYFRCARMDTEDLGAFDLFWTIPDMQSTQP